VTGPAAYPGNRFIGASWRPGADTGALDRLRAATAGWARAEGPGWLLASERPGAFAATEAVAVALTLDRAFDRAAATFRTPAETASALAKEGATALAGMAAPFRAAWADRAEATVHGETDRFGLGQMFMGSVDGFAAVASSATLLANVLGAPLSPETLAGYAAFGGFIAEETPFAGVTKLLAGSRTTLRDGRVATTAAPAETRQSGDLVEAFRAAVSAMLRAAPDAELELSGGLDSRLILAAMPPDARQGRSAITIGVAGEPSDDVTVARALAEREGLSWTFLDAGGIAAFTPDLLDDLLSQAVAGYDHMANPLDKAALIVAGHGRSVQARFGGQNGEILRGFYYVGQPLDAAPTEALARRLIDWRLKANDRVDETLLSADLRGDLRAAAEARMSRLLLSQGGTWSETLDRFYLAQRMQNWVGNSTGNRLMDHAPLYPFFDSAVVDAAMATPAGEKLNSRAAYRLLCDLDMTLARRPLADGVVPASLPTTRLGQRLSDLRLDAGKALKRVRRKLAGAGRPTLGSQTVAQHWQRLGLHHRLPVDRLAGSGLFDTGALERIGSGQWLPDRPSLGFLLLVAGLEARS